MAAGGVAAGELSDDNDGRGLTYDTHNRITTKLMGSTFGGLLIHNGLITCLPVIQGIFKPIEK